MANINKDKINKIKKHLFGDLEVEIINNSKNPDTVTFKRRTNFGKSALYYEYNTADGEMSIYSISKSGKKIYGEKSNYKLPG